MNGESFAGLLKRHRIAAGFSQETLSELSGVSVDAISALERGARKAPLKSTLDLLMGALALDDDARLEIEEATRVARTRGRHAQQHHAFRNLPPQLTSFVNRENVLAEIEALLQSHRFVTLVGAGGAGKTRCAIKIAEQMRDEFEDGVGFAELASISDSSLVAAVIARGLNIQETPNRPILDTLSVSLKRKRLLIIVDNCEHVIEEARNTVGAILRNCPGVRILATSRESFRIAGEQIFRMPSLSVPETSDALSAELISQYASVQLFNDRASSADNRFILTAQSATDVAEICRRLDGIPLAIELAAARVTMLSPKQLAQKLDARFHVLKGLDRGAVPRHRTMRALIDWSYDLLSDDERRLLRRLSIFAGDFTLDLAASVCGEDGRDDIDVLDLLSALSDKSLVQTELSATIERFRLLESIREYAREKLAGAGEENTVAREHARAFLALAEELRDTWETTPDPVWLANAEHYLDNFEAALAWAFGALRDVLLGQLLAAALNPVWRYFPVAGRRWVQTAQKAVSVDTPAPVRAALDLGDAMLASMLGQHKASIPAAERALARYRELSDLRGIAEANRRIGHALLFLGKIDEGETLLLKVLEDFRALGARRSITLALQSLALARRFAGDLHGARQRFNEALAAARDVGALRPAATIAINLAETEFRGGDAAAAVALAEEALASEGGAGDARHVANAQYNMAAYLITLHRYDEARAAARSALLTVLDMSWPVGLAFTLQHLAAIAAFRSSGDVQADEDRRRAARVLGYVDASLSTLEAVREYTEQKEYDAVIPYLRELLGEDALAKLMAEGSLCGEEQAVAEAMLI